MENETPYEGGLPKPGQKVPFWKLRSKHGRDLLFSSPELLWDAACEFFQYCDDNPHVLTKSSQTTGGEYSSTTDNVETRRRVYTWEALALYCHCATGYFRAFKSRHKDDPEKEGYVAVIEMIGATITAQQFDGAASGQFKENIISRYLGLKDKTELSNPEDETFKVTLKI